MSMSQHVLEISKMFIESDLSGHAFLLSRLFLPLSHRLLNEQPHVNPEHIFKLDCVLGGIPAQSVLQKRIQVVIQTLGDQLNISALHGKHQWRNAAICHRIVINIVLLNQNLVCLEVSGATRKMKCRSANGIPLINVLLCFSLICV